MIDVDWFNRLNDRYGHPEGDECLRQVGTAIQTAIHRPRDLAARYGGEEFVVLLSETNEVSAGKVADHIQQAISRLAITHVDNPNGVVTVTAGVASTDACALETPVLLVDLADRALSWEGTRKDRVTLAPDLSTRASAAVAC